MTEVRNEQIAGFEMGGVLTIKIEEYLGHTGRRIV